MKLIVENLKKKFDKKEVLKGINFTFEKGKIYGLLGRNGAGKTTFFNCLNEDIKVDEGKLLIEESKEEAENDDVHLDKIKESKDKLSDNVEIKRNLEVSDIGYVISTPSVPEFLTGREFLKFFLEINEKTIENPKSIDEYFDFMKIDEDDRDKLLKDYSHGMKNKMQMLINIIAKPNILLLDEPLTSLDVVVAEEMKQMLREIKKDHILIFSTHIMELALSLCDEIVILNNGVLEEIDRDNLNNTEMKDKIIAALKDEETTKV